VESSDDAIMGKTLDGTIISWNAAAKRLFGYEPAEIIGRSVFELVPPELQHEERSILEKLSRGEHVSHRQMERLTKSGNRVLVSLTISPIRDATGTVVGASTIARDITDQKQMEEKLRVTEKLAATGRLAATIAHEINNPLEAVTNLIYLARHEKELPANVREYLERADRELERVALIARHTLGFYRDTTAQVPVHISKLLREITDLYQGRIRNKSLHVENRVDPDCYVVGFQGEIRQVLSNIIANAIDASPDDGRIILSARTNPDWRGRGGQGIRISVADEGPGIPMEIRSRIFEPFFTTKRNVGTGLGLWVSKSLAEKHGGNIRLRTRVGPGRCGTVFSVFFPTAPSQVAKAS
jgi:PAS domain S-box-containing protein